MENKIVFDEEDKRVVLGEMLSELLALQSEIMDHLLDLRLELTTTQQRIELLRALNVSPRGKSN